MIPVRIHDFRSHPSCCEYAIFYCSTACTTYIIGLALLDKLPSLYGWSAFIFLSCIAYVFYVIKRTRDIQATQFFDACIAHYSIRELQQIQPRFRQNSHEVAIVVRRIQYLQGVNNRPERSHTREAPRVSMG